MDGGAKELEDLRLDIETLRTMIDLALDKRATGDDTFLKACADVLGERRRRFDQLAATMGNLVDG